MGKLIIVPTPIGNLEDITFRAVRMLKEVDLILAEDTRNTKKLLDRYEIDTPCSPYHQHNEHKVTGRLTEKLKSEELSYALVSDAGMPGISDPAYLMIKACLKEGIEVECLPGPTAFLPALIKSGFPSDRFIYEGFLPHKKGRKSRIEQIANSDYTVLLYESPHRLLKTLKQISEIAGEDRMLSVSRELTKKFEETRTASVSELLTYFESTNIKGEFVIVIHGKT